MAEQLLRYPDLVERKIVNNRETLQRWIRKHGFPVGILIGPRSRAWTDSEIVHWLKMRRKTTAQDAA